MGIIVHLKSQSTLYKCEINDEIRDIAFETRKVIKIATLFENSLHQYMFGMHEHGDQLNADFDTCV